MKAFTVQIIFYFFFTYCNSQPVIYQWGKCIGGSENDIGSTIFSIDSNVLVICGTTESGDGDVDNHFNFYDFWIMKLDVSGNVLWNNCYGGTQDEQAVSMIKTADNGFALTGYTTSNDHDVSGRHGTATYHDIWVMKIDSIGNLIWQKCLGGSYTDNGKSIIETSDGGFIVTGETESIDGDVTNPHGDLDAWVIKLDSLGNILWSKTIGGTGPESSTSCKESTDGSIIVAGYANSFNMDFQNCVGGTTSDAWCAKLDSLGNTLWLNCYGGSSSDGFYQLLVDQSGYIYGIGGTSSNDGDVSGGHGVTDMWLTKIDNNGNLIWSKCYGGSNFDFANGATFSNDNGIIMSGFTNSSDGMISTPQHGNGDYWILKVDASGNYLWDMCIGGTAEDWATAVCQTADNKVITVGYTLSNNYDVSGNHGLKDLWITSLADNLANVHELENGSISNYECNFKDGILEINFNSQSSMRIEISITDVLGRQLQFRHVQVTKGINKIYLNQESMNNICLVNIFSDNFVLSKKLFLK